MTYGFIGLGDQGAPIARRMIDAGLALILWARRAETLAPFAGTSVEIATNVAELGAKAEHVGICVVDDVGVREICAALIPAMREGGRIVIHSTIHPNTCIELAKQAKARGLNLIDAPVSGGGAAARAGALTLMVGGDAATIAAARPVFETFSRLILHLGGVGAGQSAKLINNALMAAHVALAHNALEGGAKLGLDRDALVELINASSGRSFGFEAYAGLPGVQAFAHAANLLAKDVRLLGEALGADDPAFTAIRDTAKPVLQWAQSNQAIRV
jgi:3-hydroxyisobutyrate dehydrogenase-like beta-hydroxyacid dehydrogenase